MSRKITNRRKSTTPPLDAAKKAREDATLYLVDDGSEEKKGFTPLDEKDVVEKDGKSIGGGRVLRRLRWFLPYALAALGSYLLVMVTSLFVVPLICGMVLSNAGGVVTQSVDTFIAVWILPTLFCVGFLFIAEYRLMAWLWSWARRAAGKR